MPITDLLERNSKLYGDEIALSLLGLPCKEFRDKYKTKDFCIWMFSMEDKKAIVTDVFEKFHEQFGFYPASTGSYYLDADLTNFIKEKYPSVKCAVATCWEEGPKAYHTCNNSGIPSSTAAPGTPGSPPNRTPTSRRPTRRRTAASWPSRTCRGTCWPALTATAPTSAPTPRTCCGG